MRIPEAQVIYDAADALKASGEQPAPELVNAFMRWKHMPAYLSMCLDNPLTMIIIGAICFGWQLREKTAQMEAEKMAGRIHLA